MSFANTLPSQIQLKFLDSLLDKNLYWHIHWNGAAVKVAKLSLAVPYISL